MIPVVLYVCVLALLGLAAGTWAWALIVAGIVGIVWGAVGMVAAGDTHKGGDSGVSCIFLIACLGSIAAGLILLGVLG